MTVAAASAARSAARGGSLAAGLPMGRRTPRGRERWYLLRMPEGREATICAELKRLLPGSVLKDAFVLRKERWMKRAGVWFLEPVNMYRGYAFAISSDAAGLAKAIAGLTLPVELVGTDVRSWAPLADEAAAWYAAAMDGSHVIRSSTAVIVDGVRPARGPGAAHLQGGPPPQALPGARWGRGRRLHRAGADRRAVQELTRLTAYFAPPQLQEHGIRVGIFVDGTDGTRHALEH